MYIFIDYNNQEKTTFQTDKEFLDFLDKLCQDNGYVSHTNLTSYLKVLDNESKFNIGEDIMDGFCLSKNPGISTKGAHLLGYWSKGDSGDKN